MQSSGGNAAYSVMANLCFIGKNKMNKSVLQGIVNSGKVKDFENFLRENGIEYNLYDCEVDGKRLYIVILIIKMRNCIPFEK